MRLKDVIRLLTPDSYVRIWQINHEDCCLFYGKVSDFGDLLKAFGHLKIGSLCVNQDCGGILFICLNDYYCLNKCC